MPIDIVSLHMSWVNNPEELSVSVEPIHRSLSGKVEPTFTVVEYVLVEVITVGSAHRCVKCHGGRIAVEVPEFQVLFDERPCP